MSEQRKVPAGVVGGILLIAFGVVALIGQFLRVEIWSALWPLFIVAFGAAFFAGMFAAGPGAGGLAIPGSMFVILGLMMLAQNLFDTWASMAYAWALFAPMGVGVGVVIQSWYSRKPELKKPGYSLILIGLILFVCFGAFFELAFNFGGFGRASNMIWAVILIALGGFLIVSRLINWDRVVAALPPHEPSHPSTPAA